MPPGACTVHSIAMYRSIPRYMQGCTSSHLSSHDSYALCISAQPYTCHNTCHSTGGMRPCWSICEVWQWPSQECCSCERGLPTWQYPALASALRPQRCGLLDVLPYAGSDCDGILLLPLVGNVVSEDASMPVAMLLTAARVRCPSDALGACCAKPGGRVPVLQVYSRYPAPCTSLLQPTLGAAKLRAS